MSHEHPHEKPKKDEGVEDEAAESGEGFTESAADVEPGAPDEPPPHP